MSKKSKEIAGLSNEALSTKVVELRKDLIKLKAQAKTTGMKNSSLIKETKKMIARVLTKSNSIKDKTEKTKSKSNTQEE